MGSLHFCVEANTIYREGAYLSLKGRKDLQLCVPNSLRGDAENRNIDYLNEQGFLLMYFERERERAHINTNNRGQRTIRPSNPLELELHIVVSYLT